MGDTRALLGVTIEAAEDDSPVTVTISCGTIMEPSIFKGTLEKSGTTYTIFPEDQIQIRSAGEAVAAGPGHGDVQGAGGG